MICLQKLLSAQKAMQRTNTILDFSGVVVDVVVGVGVVEVGEEVGAAPIGPIQAEGLEVAGGELLARRILAAWPMERCCQRRFHRVGCRGPRARLSSSRPLSMVSPPCTNTSPYPSASKEEEKCFAKFNQLGEGNEVSSQTTLQTILGI